MECTPCQTLPSHVMSICSTLHARVNQCHGCGLEHFLWWLWPHAFFVEVSYLLPGTFSSTHVVCSVFVVKYFVEVQILWSVSGNICKGAGVSACQGMHAERILWRVRL